MTFRPWDNLGLKALALGLAVVLWFVVLGEQRAERVVSARVEFRDVPQGGVPGEPGRDLRTLPCRGERELRALPAARRSSGSGQVPTALLDVAVHDAVARQRDGVLPAPHVPLAHAAHHRSPSCRRLDVRPLNASDRGAGPYLWR